MPTTINVGLVDEADILSAERPVDMDPVINMLEPDETQFYTILNKLPKGPTPINSKVDWLEDVLFPRLSSLAVSAASGLSSLQPAASESPYFRRGDLCRITTTGEAFEVIGNATVSASVLEVGRGIGGTAAASAATGAEIVIVGNSAVHGASYGERRITQRTTNYNYTQIFRHPYGFTNTLIASQQYGGPILDRERHKKGVEHKRAIESSLFYGARAYQSPGESGGSEPQGFSGGLIEYITTNSRDAAGTYAYSTLETDLRNYLQYGLKNKVMFAAPMITQVFSSYSITAWTRATPDQSVWGVHIDGLLSGAFGWGVPVFVKREWNVFGVNTTGGYGSRAFIVDMDAVKLRTMRPTQLLRNRQGNSEDQIVEEYLTELTLEVNNERKHAMIRNVTG